jgi:hypothetical protein
MARMMPNLWTPPSVFAEEKSTKNPIAIKNITGIKLKTKHIAAHLL